MNFVELINSGKPMLTEGAIVERLKNEFGIVTDEFVNHAGLIYHTKHRAILSKLYNEYISVAREYQLPIMLMTPTRRANKERVQLSAYKDKAVNYDCVEFLKKLSIGKNGLVYEDIFIGGLMGCKGDAYNTTEVLSTEEAYTFHSWQAQELKKGGVDYLFAGIMPALSEAVGMAMAMSETNLPYIISFMIKGNGCLLDGKTINEAIKQIDGAAASPPIGYMANCVHPIILNEALSRPENQTDLVRKRFLGLQANTSALSPKELNNANGLHTEEPDIFGKHMQDLYKTHHLRIHGGCCGTNQQHLKHIASYIKEGR